MKVTDIYALQMIALYPEEYKALVEKLDFDAQRIGDILIGRAIPAIEKLTPHHEAAKYLQEWAKDFHQLSVNLKNGVCVQ